MQLVDNLIEVCNIFIILQLESIILLLNHSALFLLMACNLLLSLELWPHISKLLLQGPHLVL
jgi:hypothetical protein